MKYKCLCFDHDDTVVNSTATIHWPCFVEFLKEYRPGMECSLENYFIKNFDPGFIQMCHEDFGLSDHDLDIEVEYWAEYVKNHIPNAYTAIKEIMERHISEGGIIAVISHSFKRNILRDYEFNQLPAPSAVYGWDYPEEQRKPNPYPLIDLMSKFNLMPNEILMIDDLKPGYDMAKKCGVDFAAVGWSNDVKYIENYMRSNCELYFKTVKELSGFLFD